MKSASNYMPDVGFPTSSKLTTLAAGTAFSISSLTAYGNAEISALGFNLTGFLNSALYSSGSLSISWAMVLGLASIAAVYVGNNQDIADFSNHQSTLGSAVAVSVLMVGLSSDLSTWISATNSRAAIFFFLQMIGFASIAEYSELAEVRS